VSGVDEAHSGADGFLDELEVLIRVREPIRAEADPCDLLVPELELRVPVHEALTLTRQESGRLSSLPSFNRCVDTAERRGFRTAWRGRGWVVPLFALASLLLVPWVVVLVFDLPSTHRAAHWDVAWAGFDVMLALLLLAVAVTAWRRSPWLEGAATAAATLLFVDAWFDVLTASSRTELMVAAVEALVVELPLAVLCLLLAHDAERHLVPRSSLQRSPAVGPGSAPERAQAPRLVRTDRRAA
jgi:hypothetical protein